MTVKFRLFAIAVTLLPVLPNTGLHAGTVSGLIVNPLTISANVKESLLPGGTLFEDSQPLFDVPSDPKQTAELLHLSAKGVNISGRSTNISGAFASSIAESDGNGGVGVSQTIFGNPGDVPGPFVRQLVAQSLWTQQFLYQGTSQVDLELHLVIPELQIGLIGVAPNRDRVSSTETAQAIAQLDTIITHSDGTFTQGASLKIGARMFESQVLLGGATYANFADEEFFGPPYGTPSLSGNSSIPVLTISSISTSAHLGRLQSGDILSYVYTLTAEGTTAGGEHGYFAFLGDPFGVDAIGGNLQVTASEVNAPEPGTWVLMALGIGGIAMGRTRRRLS